MGCKKYSRMEVGHRAEKFWGRWLILQNCCVQGWHSHCSYRYNGLCYVSYSLQRPYSITQRKIFTTQLIGRPNPSLRYIRHCLAYWSNHTKFMWIPFKILTRQLSRIHQDKVTWIFYLTATTLVKEVSKDNWQTSRPDDGVSLRKKLKEGWCIVGPT